MRLQAKTLPLAKRIHQNLSPLSVSRQTLVDTSSIRILQIVMLSVGIELAVGFAPVLSPAFRYTVKE
jgi:hypothetical protein